MTFQLDDRVLAIWCFELSGGNWMAFLYKEPAGYVMEYRFRWYRDDKVHDSKDKRNWYRMAFNLLDLPKGDEEAVKHGREVYEFLKTETKSSAGWELIRGARSSDEFIEMLRTMPGVSYKVISDTQAKELKIR